MICGFLLCELFSNSTGSAAFEDVIVTVVDAELDTTEFSSVLLRGGEERGDDFFLDRTPHRAAIIAIDATIPMASSENENSGCINKFSSLGILLPMT